MSSATFQIAEFNNANFGRFGNQLFKYLFLKWIQNKSNSLINVDNWLGNYFFKLPNENSNTPSSKNYISNQTYDINYNPNNIIFELINNKSFDYNIIDLYGYFQFHTSHYSIDKNFILNLFQPSEIASQFLTSTHSILASDITSIHIRRGDYSLYKNHSLFWTMELEKIIIRLNEDNPKILLNNILYIATDDHNYCENVLKKFGLSYVSNETFGSNFSSNEKLLIDFMMMSNSKALVISNSTLSFFASMLNFKGNLFLRPNVDESSLIEFNPWNSHVLLNK